MSHLGTSAFFAFYPVFVSPRQRPKHPKGILTNLLFALDIQGTKMSIHGRTECKPCFHPSILSSLWAEQQGVMPTGSLGAIRSRLLLQVLCLGHPFNSLLTYFWFCQPCMLFLFSVVPSSYPRKFCFFFFSCYFSSLSEDTVIIAINLW